MNEIVIRFWFKKYSVFSAQFRQPQAVCWIAISGDGGYRRYRRVFYDYDVFGYGWGELIAGETRDKGIVLRFELGINSEEIWNLERSGIMYHFYENLIRTSILLWFQKKGIFGAMHTVTGELMGLDWSPVCSVQ